MSRDPEIASLRFDLRATLAAMDSTFREMNAVLDDPRRLQAVNRILRRMNPVDVGELHRIVADCHESTGVKWVALVMLDDERAEVVASEERIPSGERSQSYCQMVVAAAEPWQVNDTRDNNVVNRWRSTVDYDVAAYLGVPVFNQGQCVGALCAFQPTPREWNETDVRTLQSYARRVDGAIRHIDQYAS